MEKRAIGPDILRALAILLAAGAHISNADLPDAFATAMQLYGWMGVDIFFVLSGYLIGAELLQPLIVRGTPDLRVFYLKRALRILPVFWLVLAVYVFVPGLREGPTMAPVWRFLTFTLNFGLDIRTMPPPWRRDCPAPSNVQPGGYSGYCWIACGKQLYHRLQAASETKFRFESELTAYSAGSATRLFARAS